MKYATAAAFRTALEARLKNQAGNGGPHSLVGLRKLIVFDRLLARLNVVAPSRWVLKGGVALVLRLDDRARTTKDLDLGRYDNEAEATSDLKAAARLDLDDFFVFRIERAGDIVAAEEGVAVRYRVQAELDGRRFEIAQLDVGFGDPLSDAPDRLVGPDVLAFAGIEPIVVPVLPLEQHLAEKLHAYARIYGDGRESTRVKDLVDIVLIRSNAVVRADRLRLAFDRTFAARTSNDRPAALPMPPTGWATPYRALALEVGIDPDIANGYAVAAVFLDPVLAATVADGACWNPMLGCWETQA